MDFKTYWQGLSIEEREALALKVDSTRGHLQNVAYGSRSCSEELAVALERESNAALSCEVLFPKEGLWHRVKDKSWPHRGGRPLVDHAAAQAIEPAKTEA